MLVQTRAQQPLPPMSLREIKLSLRSGSQTVVSLNARPDISIIDDAEAGARMIRTRRGSMDFQAVNTETGRPVLKIESTSTDNSHIATSYTKEMGTDWSQRFNSDVAGTVDDKDSNSHSGCMHYGDASPTPEEIKKNPHIHIPFINKATFIREILDKTQVTIHEMCQDNPEEKELLRKLAENCLEMSRSTFPLSREAFDDFKTATLEQIGEPVQSDQRLLAFQRFHALLDQTEADLTRKKASSQESSPSSSISSDTKNYFNNPENFTFSRTKLDFTDSSENSGASSPANSSFLPTITKEQVDDLMQDACRNNQPTF